MGTGKCTLSANPFLGRRPQVNGWRREEVIHAKIPSDKALTKGSTTFPINLHTDGDFQQVVGISIVA